MSAESRFIRVFVSSTFRDMGAERDHLVKFIFPQLRRLVACILFAHTLLSELDLKKLESLVQQLEAAGHQHQAEEIRRQIVERQSQNQPKKPWWKLW